MQVPLQPTCPDGQTQLPEVQVLSTAQVLVQEPQLCSLLERSVQAPEQLVVPVGHLRMHAPLLQEGVGLTQVLPQLPQLRGLSV